MPIPPYMWLKDDGGADIRSSVDVVHREGSIEIIGLSHGISLPVDTAAGKIKVHVNIPRCELKRKWIAQHPFCIEQLPQGRH